MKKLYSQPARVYLILALLCLVGIWCGNKLSISLFPPSNRPMIAVTVNYGGLGRDQFKTLYGERMEQNLRSLQSKSANVEYVRTTYRNTRMEMQVSFRWGEDSVLALRETRTLVENNTADLPLEIRRSIQVGYDTDQLAMIVAFHSQEAGIDEIYNILNPTVVPGIRTLPDVQRVELINPNSKEIEIVLKPGPLFSAKLQPNDVETALQYHLQGQSGGVLKFRGNDWLVQRDPTVQAPDDIARLPIAAVPGNPIYLSEVADVRVLKNGQNQGIVKINGKSSILMMVYLKEGGNLKSMSDSIRTTLDKKLPLLPKSIGYDPVIDRSEAVRSSIRSLSIEVIVASMLVALVLFLFIGNMRNVATAAIEIPLSIVLALIVMYIFDVNINLLSLAGLALASGMNVDASVVVLDNIMRALDDRKENQSIAHVIATAVDEVKWPVIIATLASCAIFLPFLMLEGLGKALLGDLIKAVIFSHSLSAVVALILVPTLRIHLARRAPNHKPKQPLLGYFLMGMERIYLGLLRGLMQRPKVSIAALGLFIGALIVSSFFIAKKLPKEIIGKPDSQWLMVMLETEGNGSVLEMEQAIGPLRQEIKTLLGSEQVTEMMNIPEPNTAMISVRVRNEHKTLAYQDTIQKILAHNPKIVGHVETWSQGELSLEESFDLKVSISGGNADERAYAAMDLMRKFRDIDALNELSTVPNFLATDRLKLTPHYLEISKNHGPQALAFVHNLIDDLRTFGRGKWIGDLMFAQNRLPIVMKFPRSFVQSVAELRAIPVQLGDSIIPMKSLVSIEREKVQQVEVREQGHDLAMVLGKVHRSQTPTAALQARAAQIVHAFEMERKAKGLPSLVFQVEDPNPEQTASIDQLYMALALSLVLLLVIIQIHFNRWRDSLIVMLAVPFALSGALLSLGLFSSKLSLNAVLGMTLVSGVAVNNTIILIDFAHKALAGGIHRSNAIMQAAQVRLRPIFITSLTTVLGMLPIALGLGEGGEVLRPLGIVVCSGMVVSTLLVLIGLPVLYAAFGSPRTESSSLQGQPHL